MPAVRMKSTAAGPDGTFMAGKVYQYGEGSPMSEAMANAFIDGGYAEIVSVAPVKVEAAIAAPDAEKADAPAAAPEAPRRRPRK